MDRRTVSDWFVEGILHSTQFLSGYSMNPSARWIVDDFLVPKWILQQDGYNRRLLISSRVDSAARGIVDAWLLIASSVDCVARLLVA